VIRSEAFLGRWHDHPLNNSSHIEDHVEDLKLAGQHDSIAGAVMDPD
jgi:hypothetical protein